MKSLLILSTGLSSLVAGLGAATAQQTSDPLKDVIVVSGSKAGSATDLTVSPEEAPLEGADITFLTARTPGGARVANGELSGQMQYRGLFGERLNLRVDGQRFASGGPNLMDPVFHYAPAPLVAAVVIDRGVSPVSEGPGLAGGADAIFKKVGYADGASPEFSYDLSLSGRSVNESYSGGGVVGWATDQWRFNLLGAFEEGDDTEFEGGTIGGTQFERGVYGLSAGHKLGDGEIYIDLRRQNTGASGNPVFPMDIRYMDTDFARLGYEGVIDGVTVSANVHYTDVSHAMNNFDLRPAPAMMMLRETLSDAQTLGAEFALGFAGVMGGDLSVGLDTESVDHDATITNPANANFFVTPFPEVTMDRFGGFAEWTGGLGAFESELGLRVDRHSYDAGEAVVGPALPMMPNTLAAAFNSADREGDETTVDAVIRLWTPEKDGVSWRATLARKTNMPGYIQRYGWLPIMASGGLADGNIYVGDLTLDPETAWIAEAGVDLAGTNFYARPTVYYRYIEDYIQGTPFDETPGVIDSPQEMVANMNGDSTPLVWANVDAVLYGVDMDAGYDFEGPLRLDGVVNYVRGERDDIDDNLYRIAAPSATLGLTWEAVNWSSTLEVRGVAEQNEVSLTNSEAETDGYAVVNLYGDWKVKDGVRLSAGIENLLDEEYRDHLAGYNRNGYGDAPVGERVPGAGRGVFLRLTFAN